LIVRQKQGKNLLHMQEQFRAAILAQWVLR
jgi:hypothetical protein